MRTTTKHFDATVKDSIDENKRKSTLNSRINTKGQVSKAFYNGREIGHGASWDRVFVHPEKGEGELARISSNAKYYTKNPNAKPKYHQFKIKDGCGKAKVKDSTRAMIGRKLPNGKIRYIYNHWDGYPEGVGAILSDHYSDPEKVDALLNGGDISYLGSTPSEAPWDDEFDDGGVATRFYRTRGEKNIDAKEGSLEDFENSLFDVSYLYLLGDDNQWSVKGYDDREWKPLKGYKKGYRG